MAERTYPEPVATPETGEFWQATKEGRLLLKRCRGCSRFHWYPRAVCPHCMSGETEWVEAKGEGRIYSFSVMARAEPPFAIAYVELAEGVRMMTNIVDCPLDAIRIGQAVRVRFAPTQGGGRLPVFAPG
ncbi:MAG: Zn-ribbon domain-containing OB-fold protein [Rhodospirillales bacterium]|nr:Zn-ribbon domain-containing OB-fold protein [Rhodospirillales bacterium]